MLGSNLKSVIINSMINELLKNRAMRYQISEQVMDKSVIPHLMRNPGSFGSGSPFPA